MYSVQLLGSKTMLDVYLSPAKKQYLIITLDFLHLVCFVKMYDI